MTASVGAPVLSREVRLGIVMYGGVSLAVYENGVAQELFRVVKGEGIYSFIKALTGSDVNVDIMSGTSAGGINGIFLGYALANDRDFKSCANLWRQQGDLLKLLRRPEDANTNSVLDSQGYYQPNLQDAYAAMPAYKPPAGIVSPVEEIDMFVTGTNAHGRVFTEFDSEGHPIDVKDHRQVFRLSFRRDRKNDFDPDGAAALAKLSRITSCFPVAFEPVQLKPDDKSDAAILGWGRIANEEAYFLDGGLLNNKPFTLSLNAIFHRTADREVERLLLYVEPDPERFRKSARQSMPNVAEAAFDALVSIPGYQSIASDLQEIAEHNDRVKRYQEVHDQIYESVQYVAPQQPDGTGGKLAPAGFDALDSDPGRRGAYLRCRLNQLRDRAVDGILKNDGRRLLLQDADRRAAEILVKSFEEWKGDGTRTLDDFDVYYRLRRLYRLTYAISEVLYGDGREARSELPREQVGQYRELWRRLNHQIKVLEIIQEAMEETLDRAPVPWRDLAGKRAHPDNAAAKWKAVENLMRALLDTNPGDLRGPGALPIDRGLIGAEPDLQQRMTNDRDQRKALRAALKERTDRLSAADGSQSPSPSGNLLGESDKFELEVLARFAPFQAQDPIVQEYCRFLILDSYLFPMQYMSGMESTDVIRTVRISPLDAQLAYSKRRLEQKLCGRQLGHFGGFLKASWRANDVMWGRLDAACQLVQCLVSRERIEQIPDFDRTIQCLDQYMPRLAEAEAAEIRRETTRLRDYVRAGNQSAFDRFVELLVAALQREILEEELPNVLDSAIRQQADWNEFKVEAPKSRLPLFSRKQMWSTGVRQLDREITTYAAAKLSRDPAPEGGWVKYFENEYGVGAELWHDDIPKPILLEMVATMALVLRNCLLAAAGARAQQIRSSLIYKLGLKWPLCLTYNFAHWERTAPEYAPLVFVAIFAACAAALVIEAVWWRSIFFANGVVQMTAFRPAALWWAIPPLLIIAGQFWYLRWRRKRAVGRALVRTSPASAQATV